MSIYEYDQEKHLQQERADEHAAGVAEGHAAGVAEGVQSAVINMYNSGMSIQQIMAIMHLSEEVKQFL